jgi:adenosine deaminase
MAISMRTDQQYHALQELDGVDLRGIPKVELHCHLDGIVDPTMLRDLQARGVTLAISAEALERAYPVKDAESFWHWLEVQEGLVGSIDAYRPILAAHVERLRAQNVVYTEIMVGSSEIWRCERSEVLERFRGFRDYAGGLEHGNIQLEFVAGWNRRPRLDGEVEEIARRILMLHGAGLIAGVFLAGPEEGNPVERYARTFAQFRDAGLPVEIHAGEWCGPESVWDALEYGRPQRIGHGVAIFDDPRLLDRVHSERIHVEMCPTSNVRTAAVRRINDHPIGRAHAMGMTFSINSDDPGAFECTLTDELKVVARTFGFTAADFHRVAQDSLAARFQPKLRHPNARALARG